MSRRLRPRLMMAVTSLVALLAGIGLTADGGAIVQWTDGNGTNQQFRLADSSGHVRLINRSSNKAVEAQGAATTDGANIRVG